MVDVVFGEPGPVFGTVESRVCCSDLEVPSSRGMNCILDLGNVGEVGRVRNRQGPVVVGHGFSSWIAGARTR